MMAARKRWVLQRKGGLEQELRRGSDLKRLGGAEVAYPKVGRKGELAVLSAMLLTILSFYMCLLLFLMYILLFRYDEVFKH